MISNFAMTNVTGDTALVCQSRQPVGGSSTEHEFVLHQLIMVEATGSASD